MNTRLGIQSGLNFMVVRDYKQASLGWKLRNALTWSYFWGWLTTVAAKAFTAVTSIPTITTNLRAVKIDNMGRETDYGIVSRRVVTDNGVDFITDAWRGTVELENMIYHGCGTGTGNEAASDSALGTECTTALNPDNTRATGSLAGSGSTFQTVGTLTFDDTAAVTEHGLFSQAATGGGVLMDRSKFTAINVVSTDTIQFTYTFTIASGS